MIKLTDLLKESSPGFNKRKFGDALPTLASVKEAHQAKLKLAEADSFTAINKSTGNVTAFKSKEARDSAVKAGSHDESEDDAETGGDTPAEKEKPNMFSKDAGYDDGSDDDDDDDEDEDEDEDEDVIDLPQEVQDEFEDSVKDLGYSWADIGTIPGVISFMDKDENAVMVSTGAAYGGDEPFYVSGYNLPDMEDGDSDETNGKSFDTKEDAMAYAKELAQTLKGGEAKEEPKSEPTKDSTQQRAGNTEVNKSVRNQAKKLGITPAKLGKEEYQKAMVGAAYEALTDSNFSTEARQLLAVITGDEKLAEKPDYPSMSDEDFDTKIAKIRKDREAGDIYTTPENDKASELGQYSSSESSYSGADAIDAIAFDLKMNGYKQLAAKIQSVIKED